jgi:hypothetical protein
MKDLGHLSYFLGIGVTRHKEGLFLSQKKYAESILSRAGMSSCKSCPTPFDTKSKMSATHSVPYEDPSLYRSLAGALQYLTFTRPDISYAVQQICLFMHNPMNTHMLSAGYCDTFRVQNTMVYIFIHLPLLPYYHIRMQIGVDVPTLDDRPPVTVCSLVITYSLGRLNDNPRYLDPVPKQNTAVLLMWSLNPAGYETFY